MCSVVCCDVAYPGGFEPLTFGVGVQRSIQLSYGYNMDILAHFPRVGKTVRDANFQNIW